MQACFQMVSWGHRLLLLQHPPLSSHLLLHSLQHPLQHPLQHQLLGPLQMGHSTLLQFSLLAPHQRWQRPRLRPFSPVSLRPWPQKLQQQLEQHPLH